jgi:ribosomal-protein-alanine N-acetyltransferase
VSGVLTVRPFRLEDLDPAARFCDAARALDPAVEAFGQRLGVIASGSRAALELWRVAAGEDGGLYGLAFCARRDAASRPVYDFYAAVHPSVRRQGLGRALSEPAVTSGATLRARVRDDAPTGRAFAKALGFVETGAQLSLQWVSRKLEVPAMPALRLRKASVRDQPALQKLSHDAWVGSPDALLSRQDEIAQLFGEDGRLVLLAESDGKAMGYLSAVSLGQTLGIEEVAVLPEHRRMGLGRALVARALSTAQGAVISVAESNVPARALYRSLGFRQTARRVVLELRHG